MGREVFTDGDEWEREVFTDGDEWEERCSLMEMNGKRGVH